MKFIPTLVASSLFIHTSSAALLVKYDFEGGNLNPTLIADPALLTAGPLTGDFPATVGSVSNTTDLRRLYYDNRSSFDNDTTLAVQTRWGNVTPTMRVQTGRSTLDAAISNDSFFTITLDAVQAVSLASLAFDISGSANPSYPFGLTVRSSLTGTTNLFTTDYISGLQGAPDFVKVDLSAHPQLQGFTDEVTFTFYLYAATNTSSLGIDNISFSSVPEPGSLMLGGAAAFMMLTRRRRAA